METISKPQQYCIRCSSPRIKKIPLLYLLFKYLFLKGFQHCNPNAIRVLSSSSQDQNPEYRWRSKGDPVALVSVDSIKCHPLWMAENRWILQLNSYSTKTIVIWILHLDLWGHMEYFLARKKKRLDFCFSLFKMCVRERGKNGKKVNVYRVFSPTGFYCTVDWRKNNLMKYFCS